MTISSERCSRRPLDGGRIDSLIHFVSIALISFVGLDLLCAFLVFIDQLGLLERKSLVVPSFFFTEFLVAGLADISLTLCLQLD